MIFFSYIIRVCFYLSFLLNLEGNTHFGNVKALEDYIRSLHNNAHEKGVTMPSSAEISAAFNTISFSDPRLQTTFAAFKSCVTQEYIVQSASYLSFFLEMFVDSVIKMRNFILKKNFNDFKLVIYSLSYTVAQVLYNIKKINPQAAEQCQKYMVHIITKNMDQSILRSTHEQQDINLLLAEIAFFVCQEIDVELLRYEIWDIVEILVMNSCLDKNIQAKAYDILKNYLDTLLLKARKPVVPSFSFYVTLFALKLNIKQALSDHMIAFINEKIGDEYTKKQKEHSYNDRVPKGLPEEDVINNFSYIAYFYPSKSHIVCVLNKVGWISDLVNRLTDVEYVYNRTNNTFKENLILVLPFFNAHANHLAHNYVLSDTITLSLLKRSLFSNSTQHVIPLFVSTKTNKSNNGVGVLAAYIGRDLQRTAVMSGAPDLFYQPLNDVYLSYNRVTYEPYIRISKQSSPYLKKNSRTFPQFVMNQSIFEGTSNEFWQLIQEESLFKSGNVSINPAQGYGIQKVNNKNILTMSYAIVQRMVQGYESSQDDSYGFSTLIPLRQIVPRGANLPQNSFVLTLDKKPFVLKKIEANF